MCAGVEKTVPDISFVIIEYNCVDDVRECAAHVRDHCGALDVEIVVSSNSRYPLERQGQLRDEIPGVRWVFNQANRGFAAGMSAGILHTTGVVVTIINPDARILNHGLSDAFGLLMSRPEIGLLGPRIVDSKGVVQPSCRRFVTPVGILVRTFKRLVQRLHGLGDPGYSYDSVHTADWLMGAFIMARRSAVDEVGLLDDGYFLYVEDMDWCKRFWDHGYTVIYYPELEIMFEGTGRSTEFLSGKGTPTRFFLFHTKSYLRFLKKHRMFVYTSGEELQRRGGKREN